MVKKNQTNKYTEEIQDSSQILKDLVERSDKLEKDLENSKKDYLIMLGFFIAFIAFFLIEIQILKSATDLWLLMGLSSFTLSGILLFALMLSNVIKGNDKWSLQLFSPLFVLSLGLMLASIACFAKSVSSQSSQSTNSGATSAKQI